MKWQSLAIKKLGAEKKQETDADAANKSQAASSWFHSHFLNHFYILTLVFCGDHRIWRAFLELGPVTWMIQMSKAFPKEAYWGRIPGFQMTEIQEFSTSRFTLKFTQSDWLKPAEKRFEDVDSEQFRSYLVWCLSHSGSTDPFCDLVTGFPRKEILCFKDLPLGFYTHEFLWNRITI